MTARFHPADIALVLSFYTRLPVAASLVHPGRSLGDAHWAAPLAGAVIGLVGAAAWWLAAMVLPATLAAAIALAVTVLVTGALHEDGLADTADGFGGGRDRARKLEIMRDSRIGSYGVIALVLSLLLRWAALVALAPAGLVPLALLASHAASRALIPAFMAALPAARPDGLSVMAGSPSTAVWGQALLVGLLALLMLGPLFAIIAAIVLALCFVALRSIALRQIGGQTGDVLGALQQVAEIAILLTACAMLTKGS